jgi:UDPglucose 6-dehydrogenase
MTETLVGFAGMTHLGVVSATATADKGFRTVCFDTSRDRIEALARRELPVTEPDLAELFDKNFEHQKFTTFLDDLANCDVVYVAPDVTTDDSGVSDLTEVQNLISLVMTVLRQDAILIVLSQVPPGFTRALRSDPKRIFYQVETLIFGAAVIRATLPERFIVGAADPSVKLPAVYREILEAFNCPILPMRYESAELAKISINMFLTASVTTTNMLAEICERTGADWFEIAPALRLDRRIGQHAYLQPGLGLSGGNLERDLTTITGLGDALGGDVGSVRSWQFNSRHRRDWVLAMLHRHVLAHRKGQADTTLAILGLAYKAGTHSTKNSPAVALLDAARSLNARVYDPTVVADPAWHPSLVEAENPLDACDGSHVLAIMTPWSEFRDLDPKAISRALAGRVVLDPYGLLDYKSCQAAGLEHHRIGVVPLSTAPLSDSETGQC